MIFCWSALTKPIWRTRITLTAWYTSSYMTIALSGSGRTRTMTSKNYPGTMRCCRRISVCTWKWRLSCSFTMYFVIAGVVPTGHPKGSGSFRLSTGEMNPRLISALRGSKEAVWWLSPPTWRPNTTTARIKKSGSWLDTTRCCVVLSRKKLSVTIHRFPKCRATLSMWITSAVPGGIWTMNEVSVVKIWMPLKLAAHPVIIVIQQ